MSYFKTGFHTTYSKSKLPEMNSPYLLCGFPGSGYVGKLAVDYLIKELNAIHLADIYSSELPPQVTIRDDGNVDLMKNILYYKKGETNGVDLLFLTGDAQPINGNSEYILAEEILRIVSQLHASKIITLGAYITGSFTESPRVFGAATNEEVLTSLKSQKISKIQTGSIVGMNGLLVGMAKLYGIEGICLLGETSGYVIDANASKYLLEILLSILDLKINMEEINKKSNDTILLIRTIEQQIEDRAKNSEPQQADQIIQKKQPEMGYIS